jgi:hypothetical protein
MQIPSFCSSCHALAFGGNTRILRERESSLLTTYWSESISSSSSFGGPASCHGTFYSLFEVALYISSYSPNKSTCRRYLAWRVPGYHAQKDPPCPPGPYSRTKPRTIWWSWGGGLFLTSEVPLYRRKIARLSVQAARAERADICSLTECIYSFVVASQLPPKIVNLSFQA